MRKIESRIFNKDYIVPEKHDVYAKAATLYRYTEDRKRRFYHRLILKTVERIRDNEWFVDMCITWGLSVFMVIWLWKHTRWR